MEELSERDIIKKIKNGEIDYFASFVKRFSQIIYYYAKKRIKDEQDVPDIVQNSFIKAYKGMERFDEKKTFYPYLFTILKNEIIDYYRKKKYHVKIEEDHATYEERSINEATDFTNTLDKLKPESGAVIKLYYIEGYSYKEIAGKLKKPINTVKTLLHRGKSELKKIYEKEN
jgi:RNA polymerase sigma-70 factor (ECF subfamily)